MTRRSARGPLAELQADLYATGAKTRVPPEMTKLRKELGGLLHPTSHKPGDNRYRFGHNVTVGIHQGTSAAG